MWFTYLMIGLNAFNFGLAIATDNTLSAALGWFCATVLSISLLITEKHIELLKHQLRS